MSTDPRAFYSSFIVKSQGSPLSADQANSVLSLEIEQNIYLPSAFAIRFDDSGLGSNQGSARLALLNDTSFMTIGNAIEIAMGYGDTPQTVFKGEVTSIELDVAGSDELPCLVVRGYDKGHRLHRGRNSKTYLNVKDSDLASTLAGSAGLSASTDETSLVFDTISQNNQTNWEFLVGRAKRIGYEVFVDDTTLHFRKPKVTDAAAGTTTLWDDLIRLNLRMTAGSQVSNVSVQGWDPQQKQQIVGTASSGAATATGGSQQSGSTLDSSFGTSSTMMLANRYVVTQDDATKVAQAVLDEMTAEAIKVEGEMKGNPSVKPGQMFSLAGLGSRFNGSYYVTSATHRFNARTGYTTRFTVSGHHANTLGELVGQAATANGHSHGASEAVTIGVVTDNNDPKNLGRVKVKLPYVAGTQAEAAGIVTDWARIVVPGGGATRGMFFLPEVNDEVLVAFEEGDVNRPFVLGGLWNGSDAPPQTNTAVLANNQVKQRIIQSRTGHVITMDDSDDKPQVSVVTKAGHKVILDDTSSAPKITVVDKTGSNTITIDSQSNKITVSSSGDLELKATQNLTMSGQQVSITAQQGCSIEAQGGQASMKGVTTNLEAQTSGTVKASASLTVQSNGTLSVQASGPAQVQGNPIALN